LQPPCLFQLRETWSQQGQLCGDLADVTDIMAAESPHLYKPMTNKEDERVRCVSVLEAIGNTPLVRLARFAPDLDLWGKLECVNPGGSAKDRLARHLVLEAEARGLLKPGATLVEATAGNTGVSLALVAAVRGYRCVVVVPHGTSPEKQALARAYGAEVRVCTPDEDYIEKAEAVAREVGGFRPDQFRNPDNPAAHSTTTAQEILRDLDGQLDCLVAACGTGGTLAGIGRALRQRLPSLRIARVVPHGDAPDGESRIEGIAPDGPPPEFECPLLDAEIRVHDDEARAACRELARSEGLLVGGSSGAAAAGARRWAQPGQRVVVLLPDTGRNYLHELTT
jgi:cysteine synthase